jgi:hypothetical protein
MNLDYNLGIPAAGDNPSFDQGLMQTNTNSIGALITVDHYGFKDNFGGYHKQVTLPALLAIPGTITIGMGVLYTKASTSISPLTETDLFYTPDASTNEYQLTRTITGKFTTFGTNTNYAPPVVNQNGGWTFLPGQSTNGALIYQYGSMLSTGTNTLIAFPITFPNALFSVTAVRAQGSSSTTTWGVPVSSTSGFTFSASSGTTGVLIYWMAIGN